MAMPNRHLSSIAMTITLKGSDIVASFSLRLSRRFRRKSREKERGSCFTSLSEQKIHNAQVISRKYFFVLLDVDLIVKVRRKAGSRIE